MIYPVNSTVSIQCTVNNKLKDNRNKKYSKKKDKEEDVDYFQKILKKSI